MSPADALVDKPLLRIDQEVLEDTFTSPRYVVVGCRAGLSHTFSSTFISGDFRRSRSTTPRSRKRSTYDQDTTRRTGGEASSG